MPNETHRAPLRYNIPDFFSSLLESKFTISMDADEVDFVPRHDHILVNAVTGKAE
jgi:hypothetical protein